MGIQRIPLHLMQVVDKHVNEIWRKRYPLIAPGLHFGSRAQKNASMRFCIYYRQLKDVTVNDAYPLPKTEEALIICHGILFFYA